MKFTRRAPCGNCPFRKDAKLAYWHPTQYLMLQRIEQTQNAIGDGTIFACHKDRQTPEKEPCVGWLINQRERGVPSLQLRLMLATKPEALPQFEESEPDGELYETIEELVERNLRVDRLMNPQRYGPAGEYLGDDED